MIPLGQCKRNRGHAPRSYLSLVLGVLLGIVCAALGAAYWPALANAPRQLMTSRRETYMYPGCCFSFSAGGATGSPGTDDVRRVDEFLVTENWALRPLAPHQGIFDLGEVALAEHGTFPASVDACFRWCVARQPNGPVPEPRLVTGHTYWVTWEDAVGLRFRVQAIETHPVARALVEYTRELPLEAAPGRVRDPGKAPSEKEHAAARERVGEALRQLRWKVGTQIPKYRDGLKKQADMARQPAREDGKPGPRPGQEEELKQIAELLAASDVHEMKCKETIVRLEMAERTLQRASWFGEFLGQAPSGVPAGVREAEKQAAARLEVKLGKGLDPHPDSGNDSQLKGKGLTTQTERQSPKGGTGP